MCTLLSMCVRTPVHTYVRDLVRLRLRLLSETLLCKDSGHISSNPMVAVVTKLWCHGTCVPSSCQISNESHTGKV